MKTMKKAFALVLALAMVMSLSITGFAASFDYTMKVINDVSKTNVVLENGTYEAVRVFDLDYSKMPAPADNSTAYNYTVHPAFQSADFQWNGFNAGTPADCTAMIEALSSADASQIIEFNKAVVAYMTAHPNPATAYAKVSGSLTSQGTGSEKVETITFSTNDAGYYLITSVGSATENGNNNVPITALAGMDTTDNNFEVHLKAKVPVLTKKFNKSGENAPLGTHVDSDVAVGDVLEFVLSTEVPDIRGYEKYELGFYDKVSNGLEVVMDGRNPQIDIIINGKNVNYADDSSGIDISLHGELLIYLEFIALLQKHPELAEDIQPGNQILVKYKAKVNQSIDHHLNGANSCNLLYSANPYDYAWNDSPKKICRAFTFGIDVDKYSMWDHDSNAATPLEKQNLAGAAFVLSTSQNPADEDTVFYRREVVDLDGNEAVSLKSSKADATVLVTNSDGKLCEAQVGENGYTAGAVKNFDGLPLGTYYLHEIQAPDGYHKLTDPVRIKLEGVYTGDNLTKVNFTAEYINNQGGQTDAPVVGSKEIPLIDAPDVHIKFTAPVFNTSGTELPSTGGMGTTIFYTVGAVMMAGALVLLITKKKMSVN